MKPRSLRRRGQPVIAFCGLMGFWLALRVVATALPGSPADGAHNRTDGAQLFREVPAKVQHHSPLADTAPDWRMPQPAPAAPAGVERAPLALPGVAVVSGPIPPAFTTGQPVTHPDMMAPAMQARPNPMLAGGHQLLFLSALSQVPLPAGLVPAPLPTREAGPRQSRWSGDGWLLLRRGGGAPALAAIGGSYGASQAGMVLRYRLDTSSALRPAAYLRASAALNGLREQEAAVGLSLRPLAAIPVAAMAEARATRTATGTRLRPAAALVTQLAPLDLPLRLKAEAYGQAGWVGGAGSTAFVDGQLRIERPLARLAGAELAAGAGTWGGAQKGASRLDVGPTARITLHPTQSSTVRVAADWRFRVAGSAAPQSGPAITLSAGF
ncbi:hypothetical protein [Novosphingobium sp. TH158]|uniref:hypothetical protein n=1 Tax=Novosphingobium sp. TH158 TaxID=2067455 RepID=UPI000C7DDD78|nr:hypothetical protein [Novosphingobium sp. TH158]PLK26500.1 hypothetical protein C0V78_06070 [Novosphingobium sp. TH158]